MCPNLMSLLKMIYLLKVINLKEDEDPVFNFSILNIYKKEELTDDNNSIFK